MTKSTSGYFIPNLTLQSGENSRSFDVQLRVQNSVGNYDYETVTITIVRKHSSIYYLTDHLGSVRVTVDEQGNSIGWDDYYPFGLQMPGRSSNSANPNDAYKYIGEELDDEAGINLMNLNARMYDPAIARFMQVDPLFDHPNQMGLSPYNYSWNNPINLSDPTGECPACFYSLWVKLNVEETKYLAGKTMKASEIKVVKENRWSSAMIALNGNRGIAEKMSSNSGLSINGIEDGPIDALRHSQFNALNTQTAGSDVTKALGDAHEQDRPKSNPLAIEMDLHNIAIGREVGAKNPNASPKQLTNILLDRMQKGDLKVCQSLD